ncbi:MAG: hypothetical protein IJM13_08535 [Lachnospiraceae bacterium]|nr:hypothetical protein [Lachnospiraceae bacterium]
MTGGIIVLIIIAVIVVFLLVLLGRAAAFKPKAGVPAHTGEVPVEPYGVRVLEDISL